MNIKLPDLGGIVFTKLTFKGVRQKLGVDQEEMATRLGITRSYLSQIENKKKSPSGDLERRLHNVAGSVNDTGRSSSPMRGVPVISWARAGLAASYEEIPKEWQETIPTDCPDEHAFALIIEGDSMEPKYVAGDVAVVMPGQRPRTNCLVAARIHDEEVVFKVLTLTNGARPYRLTSYNHQIYQPRELRADEVNWVYPVYEVRRRVWR